MAYCSRMVTEDENKIKLHFVKRIVYNKWKGQFSWSSNFSGFKKCKNHPRESNRNDAYVNNKRWCHLQKKTKTKKT